MGVIDTEGKQYMSRNIIFADAFNYLLYDGEQVIDPQKLKELDTTQITAPYGNQARVPMQKYRDLLKIWEAMTDDDMIYVILGAELQSRTHYGMPVKDGLYDMIGYSKQIEEARQSYKEMSSEKQGKEDSENEAELFVEDGTLKIKLTSEEFLSGFRKGDKLIPIITAVVYINPEPWDGPMSLFEMLDVKDKRLYKYLNDYKLNLIAPINMEEDDFQKFHTDLGLAMRVLKHQNDGADKVIGDTNHRKIDKGTAVFLNRVAKLGLEYDEKEDEVDMCLAMEKKEQRDKITGAIEAFRMDGISEEDIIAKVMKLFNVSKEYVLALLTPKTV